MTSTRLGHISGTRRPESSTSPRLKHAKKEEPERNSTFGIGVRCRPRAK